MHDFMHLGRDQICAYREGDIGSGFTTSFTTAFMSNLFWLLFTIIVEDNIIMKGSRAAIPICLTSEYLQVLHKGHSGVESTNHQRTKQSVFRLSVNADIKAADSGCNICKQHEAPPAKRAIKTTCSS